MDPQAVLALIGDLYSQIGRLNAENAQLRAAAAPQEAPTASPE